MTGQPSTPFGGLKIIGYLFIALVVAGLCLQLILASTTGRPFIGQNLDHPPIGTYSTIGVMVLAATVGVYALIRRIGRRPK